MQILTWNENKSKFVILIINYITVLGNYKSVFLDKSSCNTDAYQMNGTMLHQTSDSERKVTYDKDTHCIKVTSKIYIFFLIDMYI